MNIDGLISKLKLNHKIGGSRKEIEDIADVSEMTNTQLKCIIQEIEMDKEGNIFHKKSCMIPDIKGMIKNECRSVLP